MCMHTIVIQILASLTYARSTQALQCNAARDGISSSDPHDGMRGRTCNVYSQVTRQTWGQQSFPRMSEHRITKKIRRSLESPDGFGDKDSCLQGSALITLATDTFPLSRTKPTAEFFFFRLAMLLQLQLPKPRAHMRDTIRG